MVGFSVPVAVIGGITAYVGLYHLLLYFRRKTYREGLAFALLCFAMVVYDCLAVGLYNASSLAEGHLWQRLQESSLALTVVAFLWFFKVYFACAHLKKWPLIVSLYLVSSAVFCLLDQSGLAWLRDRSVIREILLPWGEPIVYYGVLRGPLIHLQDIVGTLTFAYLTWIAIKLYRSSHAERIRPLFGVMVFMSIGILNDLALSVSLYRSIYLLEYTNFAVVLLMTYSLSGEVMQMQQALQGSQQMLQSIMDNLPQAIFWKGHDLTFCGCNREFAADAGLERSEDIVGKSDSDMPWAELAEQYRLDDLQVLQTGIAKLNYEEPRSHWRDVRPGCAPARSRCGMSAATSLPSWASIRISLNRNISWRCSSTARNATVCSFNARRSAFSITITRCALRHSTPALQRSCVPIVVN